VFMLELLKSTHILLLIVCSNSRYFNVIGSDPEGKVGRSIQARIT
jgi:UDP-glucose 4-epimerase